MEDYNDFDYVFSFSKEYVYDGRTVETILANRRKMENELFFDRLLKLLRIDQATRSYPPRTNQELRSLHQKIVSSSSPDHHKQSLLFYILRDCIAESDVASTFSRKCYLPEKYEIYMNGLWEMDRMYFENALEYLTQPSLIPTFPEEILCTLIRHAPKDDPTLPLAYYHTVTPSITGTKTLEALYLVLSSVSVSEAFSFSRGQAENVHKKHFEQLISSALSDSAGKDRADRAVNLINLPLNLEEEAWFEDFLLFGKGKALHGARDTVMMRRVAMGKYFEALKDGKALGGRKIDGLSWDTLKSGIDKGLGHRKAAGELMDR
ncbi:MAG: hypothetical protein M1827_000003 [Pycnora praestabilis]|nr:MAG: hypothetical protein M1827_000003 [Pycnora praestabilis]